MLLAAIAFALSVTLGLSPTPTPAPSQTFASHLPTTQPGLSRDEGVFLFTYADDGSRAVYFVAQNARHSILVADMQLEQQINPLWPMRWVSRDEVMAFPEAAPIGLAPVGLLLGAPVASAPAQDAPTAVEAAAPASALDAPAVVDAPAPIAVETPTVAVAAPAITVEAPMVADAAPANADAQPTVYVLRPGDNLTRLSAQYGTTVQAILAANGLTNANRIFVGQALTIPTATGGAQVVETPADPAPVAQADPQPVADLPAADTTAATTYTVQRGDSAILIARRFGVDEAALLQANGIVNANRVYIGQTLTIPGA